MAFASVMIVPVSYYIVMGFWLPKNRLEQYQFMLGLAIFVACGPFVNISVTLYAIFYMDNFSWGKTRQVIADDDVAVGAAIGDNSDSDVADVDHAAAAGVGEKAVEPPAPGLPAPPDDPATLASGHRLSSVADIENQLDQIRQPYDAPAGSRLDSVAEGANAEREWALDISRYRTRE